MAFVSTLNRIKQIPSSPQFHILSLQVAHTGLGRRVTQCPSDSQAPPASYHMAGVGGHHTATATDTPGTQMHASGGENPDTQVFSLRG